MIKIYDGKYKDQKCIVLEGEKLLIKILPNLGGKIQSIYNKEKRKEYLYQSPWEEYKKSGYDTMFEDGEFSGFDEMFPSISKCSYPSGPWEGITVPDHGEVWSIPWDYKTEGNTVLLNVYGVRFPYKIERKIEFINDYSIRISYKLTNLSSFDFDFIWAAHPLFNCNENMRIIIPKSVKKIVNTVPSNRLGGYGVIHDWPVTTTPDGLDYDISRISPESSKLYEKYYVSGKLSEGWCALQDTKSGEVIGLSYPVDKVPYLGFWINEGGYVGQYNAALEPCTGALDRIDTAKQWNQMGVIKARSEVDWFLNIVFGTSDIVNYIDEEGNIK
jgi:galactose mutarotase-like enzyme